MRKTALAAALMVLVAGSGMARANTGPGFEGDLRFTGSEPTTDDIQHKGQEMLDRMGRDYHALQLLAALEAVGEAVRGEQLIPAEAQEALFDHGRRWSATYARELGENSDLDQLWSLTMAEQAGGDKPSPSRDFEVISQRLEGLYLATSRYNQALALRHNGTAGFSSRKARPEGTIGLDPSQIAQVQVMLDGLSRQIVDSTSNLRAALQRT